MNNAKRVYNSLDEMKYPQKLLCKIKTNIRLANTAACIPQLPHKPNFNRKLLQRSPVILKPIEIHEFYITLYLSLRTPEWKTNFI